MPFKTITGTDTKFALIAFDKNGAESRQDPEAPGSVFSGKLLSQIQQEKPSHIFFFSHGWKGDVGAAVDQYNRWIKAMLDLAPDHAAMGAGFKPMWIGLHWPSLPWGDEELGPASFSADGDMSQSADQLVEIYLDRLGLSEQARPLLETIVLAHKKDAAADQLPADAAAAYTELASLAGRNVFGAELPGTNQTEGLSGPPEADGEPFDAYKAFDAGNAASKGVDFGGPGGFLGGILGPLRQLSYWTMKKRARTIGESGMHSFVGALMNAAPDARFHLMGHSFGCIVVSSILGGPGARRALPRPVDSAALVQGAVSLWAFADRIPMESGTGYFNPFLDRGAVRGPIITTRSRHDHAVGRFYPLASAAVLASASFDPEEDELPKYGGIGSFGMQGLPHLMDQVMLPETQPYKFAPGKIYNLEASQFIAKGGGASGAHSDIDGPEVAHALWQAAIV